MSRTFALVAFVFCFLSLTAHAQDTANNKPVKLTVTPTWVWASDTQADDIAIRYEFELQGEVKQALLAATADNHCDVFINGKKVASSDDWSQLATAEVGKRMKSGRNAIAITARDDGGAAGVMAVLIITMADGATVEVVTNEKWTGSVDAKGNWSSANFDDTDWARVQAIGKLGETQLPWTGSVDREALLSAFGSGSGGEFIPEIAAHAQVPEGFKIERIYHVPRAMGSWVALTTLTTDPKPIQRVA